MDAPQAAASKSIYTGVAREHCELVVDLPDQQCDRLLVGDGAGMTWHVEGDGLLLRVSK